MKKNRCDQIMDFWKKGAVGPRQTEKKRRFTATENDSRKDKTEKKIKKKASGVAKSVARVLPLACTNEYLLRTMDSLVAVQ